jgi:hypothetical protein
MSTPLPPEGVPIGVRHVELAGVTWTVREMLPAAVTASQRATLLVFDSGLEQRRLDPAPSGWLDWDDTQLQDACLRASTWRHQGVEFG